VAEVLSVFDDVVEANVYGVRVPGAEGRAGMAALVAAEKFDMREFYGYVASKLPSYARPLFLRMRASMDTTGTFKHRKVDLVREGYDPEVVKDPLYIRDEAAATYLPLDRALHDKIVAGELPL
jgi:fatty-acyl-CoA synthase